MEEQGESRNDELSCNDDVGPCVSSDIDHNASIHQVVTDHGEMLVGEEQHDEQLNSNSISNTNTNTNTNINTNTNRWLPFHMSQWFRIPLPNSGSPDHMVNDAWSCTIVLLTFWLFASMILVLGFYGSSNLQLGPNSSYAFGANPFFAHSIKAQAEDDRATGPMLYGFHQSPSLDIETTWSKTHNVSVEPDYHRDWTYYLNAGSRVDISYDVKSPNPDFLSIVIVQGREALVNWMDDPSNPNTALSWDYVYGNGRITQEIMESGVYYIAVGNLNMKAVEVYLNITVLSRLYNTTNADFQCSLSNTACSFKLKLMKPNVAVLATPGPSQDSADTDFYIEVSFGLQWLTYCIGSCIVTAFILAMFRCCDKPQTNITFDTGNQGRENSLAEREPLISQKSDTSSTMGSSYESASNEEDDVNGDLEGKATKDGGSNSKNARLCAICFDSPKDCFFVPCGHSAACFTCGSRIAEEAGTCPICRRKLKKVRKIFLA